MTENLIEIIKQRSRPEWEQLVKDRWTELRIWIQENGELAAVISLVVGIFFVLAFKLVVILAVLVGLAGFGVWYLAPAQARTGVDGAVDQTGDSDTPNNRSENFRPTEH